MEKNYEKQWLFIGNYWYKLLIMTKLCILLLICSIAVANAGNAFSQKVTVNFSLSETNLYEVIQILELQTGFGFSYDVELESLKISNISLTVEDEEIEKVLDMVFKNTDIHYRVVDKIVLLSKAYISHPKVVERAPAERDQQQIKISGTVTDARGEPVIGASVVVKGTTIGINTDIEGKFQIAVPPGSKTLVISFIGMKSSEVNIEGKVNVDVKLEDETTLLEEVVIVGYGTQKKVTVTGAVTSVGNAQLVQSPVANISTMLTGRTTGLLAVQRTGEPGADQSIIRIRGASTFSGSQEPLIMVDGIETKNYNNIDPNEIENVSILKDASATAVYGVRGANGVVIITTKRGKTGKPQISFSTNFAVNKLGDMVEGMNAYDWAWGFEEAKKYDSYITGAYAQKFTETDLQLFKDGTDPIFHPDADFKKLLFKEVSYQNQQNLNIRGGTEKVKYFVSAGLFHQGGQFNNTDLQPDFFDRQTIFDRYNFRSNFDFEVTKRLKVAVNLSDQIEQKRGLNMDDIASMMTIIFGAPGLNHPAPIDDKVIETPIPFVGSGNNAIVSFYNGGFMKRYRNYLNGSVRLNYDLDMLTKGLSMHATFSYQNFNQHKLSYDKTLLTYAPLKDASGNTLIVPNGDDSPVTSSQSTDKYRHSYVEFGFDYSRSFGDHNFNALLLYNQSKLFDPDLQYVIPKGYQGTVARIAYDYKGRYLVEFNMGHNGTENFAPGKRFGFFPAYSVGWVLSQESFFPKNDVVSFVKFRGSYGEVGNDQIGGNRFLYTPASYNYQGTYFFGVVGTSSYAYQGAYEGKIGNTEVTWERAKKTDIGIELKFLKDRISISADYFYEIRDNILATRNTLSSTSGIGSNYPATNLGEMENRGYDGEIGINLKSGKFNYWIKANYTYAHNKVLFQDEIFNPYSYQYRTGQRSGQMFGPVEVEGLYNSWMEVNDAYRPKNAYQNNRLQPGDIRWKDINGDGLYDQYDTGPIGYSDFPEKTFGISIGGDYRGFDFSILAQGNYNVSFWSRSIYVEGWRNSYSQTADYLKNSWSQERYEAGLPIYFPHYNIMGGTSTVDVQPGTYINADCSYIRLMNAELGYTFNKNNLFRSIGISSARVYVNGSNLYTYTRFFHKQYPLVDPELLSSLVDAPYPKPVTVNFGASLTF